jgi:hypothetical protein
MAINVPLNDAIKAAGDPDQINVATVRAAFHESTWAAWNYVRVVAGEQLQNLTRVGNNPRVDRDIASDITTAPGNQVSAFACWLMPAARPNHARSSRDAPCMLRSQPGECLWH